MQFWTLIERNLEEVKETLDNKEIHVTKYGHLGDGINIINPRVYLYNI